MFKWRRALPVDLMNRLEILENLRHDGWLWISLLLLGPVFWWVGSGLTQYSLSQSTRPVQSLQVVPELTPPNRFTLSTVRAYVDLQAKRTRVEVKTLNSPPQDSTFELPLIEFDEIEAAIATKLDVPSPTARRLVRYQIIR